MTFIFFDGTYCVDFKNRPECNNNIVECNSHKVYYYFQLQAALESICHLPIHWNLQTDGKQEVRQYGIPLVSRLSDSKTQEFGVMMKTVIVF